MFLACILTAACTSSPTGPATAAKPAAPERVSGQQFTVFFSFGQSTISEQADEVLRDCAALIQQFAPTRVKLTGHTDTAEPDPDPLSAARANAVAQRLKALMVTAEIQARGVGANDLLVQTAPGTRDAQNRRVTIDY